LRVKVLVWGSDFRVKDLGFGVLGLGFNGISFISLYFEIWNPRGKFSDWGLGVGIGVRVGLKLQM
jgi:hypothetical protein